MKKGDFVLIYLLMSVDGTVSAAEEEQFDKLLKQSGYEEPKSSIIIEAKKILKSVEAEKDGAENTIQLLYDKYKSQPDIKNELDSQYGIMGVVMAATNGMSALENATSRKTYYKEILWTMVNMAMIDNDFSENEKKLIECCCKDWKIEDSFMEEMIEIAKTLYSLYSHLDFLKSINRPYGEIEPLVNELNVNKAILEENLKELLSA